MTALVLCACAGPSDSRPDTATRTPVVTSAPSVATYLVDTTLAKAVAGQDGWNYQQNATADLDGDGQIERVVLTARVEMMRGRAVWDDGQPWQAYVEETDHSRTYFFARFVQLGMLSLRLSEPDSGQRPRIVLLEQLPDRLAIYEVDYLGPGRATTTAPYERALDPRGDVASPTLP